jgi:hypothetical protein
MSLNKIILSIILGLSFHSTIMSMENEINEQINLINRFVNPIICHETKDIEPLTVWLVQKRNNLHYAAWNSLLNDLTTKITLSESIWKWEVLYKREIDIVINTTIRNLQPNQGNPLELAQQIKDAVYKVALDYAASHSFSEKHMPDHLIKQS